MAFAVTLSGCGGPLVVVGCQRRPSDAKESRRAAKALLQSELSRHWRTRGASGLPLHYSYSHLPNQTWAAATDQSCLIGIDAASDSEFDNSYPLQKVFHPAEIAAGSPGKIWSAKEAVVKALGCGFDGINPLDVRIAGEACSTGSGPGNTFPSTADIAQTAVTAVYPAQLRVWSQQQADGIWVSLAYGTLINR